MRQSYATTCARKEDHMREKLPTRRRCVTQSLNINGTKVHFTVGLYPDGRPGEVFIDMHRTGTSVRGWCGSTAKLISLMLQYHIPLSELVEALVGDCTEPFGRVPVSGHPVIEDTSGVLDAVMRSLALDFLAEEQDEVPPSWLQMLKLTEHKNSAELYEEVEAAGEAELLDTFLEKFA